MSAAGWSLLPRSLFGRTALVIASVSIAFQLFTLAIIFLFLISNERQPGSSCEPADP